MSSQLFIIKNINGIHGIYTDIEKSKMELKDLYNTLLDYHLYKYTIHVYTLIGDEYMDTTMRYTYKHDIFMINMDISNDMGYQI
jgi:hypothetical protein